MIVQARAKVEFKHEGRWCFSTFVFAANDKEAGATGIAAARGLWRAGVAGVRVTVSTDRVVLEHSR